MLGRTEHRGVCRLLSSVMSGTEPHTDRQEDYRFLQSMLMEKKLHLLFKIHERLRRFEKRSPLPAQEQAAALAPDLLESLAHQGRQTEFKELLLLLSKPHFKSLLTVHDAVAQKDFEPTLPPMPDIVLDEDESLVKIVSLVKTKEPLGATIKRDESTGAIVVARIMRGGAAHKSGLIHEGDELREVNGVSLERKKPKEVLPLLARSRGEVTFTVVPASTEEEPPTDKKLYVRTLFGYEPGTDPAVPCREAALRFGRGDVLRILSKEDDAWWQARRCGDGENRAGLIPSPQLQERRVALRRPSALFEPRRVRTHLGETAAMREGTEEKLSALCGGRVGEFSDTEQDADYGALTGIHIAGLRRSFRLGRKGGRARDAPARRRSCGVESLTQTPTYMEVVPYRRTPEDRGRLVVLVGPGGVGVSELKRRLLLFDPDRFGLPVPHTSREKRTAERDGVHYNFTSRRGFEEDILNHRLIEYGSYRGHYYGTSVDSVHQVMAEGKVCILDVQPNAIRSLYTCEFKPYVVFVKPPPVEELRLTRRKAKMICDEEDRKTTRMFSEADFEEMMDSAEATEIQFGHLFDRTVVNGDLAAASGELRAVLQEMAGPQVQWLPAAWTRPKPKSTQSLP